MKANAVLESVGGAKGGGGGLAFLGSSMLGASDLVLGDTVVLPEGMPEGSVDDLLSEIRLPEVLPEAGSREVDMFMYAGVSADELRQQHELDAVVAPPAV